MPKVVAPRCTECDAPLPPAAVAGLDAPGAPHERPVRCEYCGSELLVARERRPTARPRVTTMHAAANAAEIRAALAQAATVAQRRSAGRFARLFVALAVLGPLAGLLVTHLVQRSVLQAPGSGTGVGSGGHVPAGEHMQWVGHSTVLLPADVNGDGTEDIVGVYRNLGDSGDSIDSLGAFDGRSFDRIWGQPLTKDSALPVHAAAAGGQLAVTVGLELRVLDTHSGKQLAVARFDDVIDELCVPPGDAPWAWVELHDDTGHQVALPDGSQRDLRRPAACAEVSFFSECSRLPAPVSTRCQQAGDAHLANIDGFEPIVVLEDAGTRVAIGHKARGTAVPMLAGIDDANAAAWVARVADGPPTAVATWSSGDDAVVDLAGGRLAGVYELTAGGARVFAFDARTGGRLWNVPLPRSEDGSAPTVVRVTATHIYVPHWTWLDVFDAASGDHLATIGMW